MTMPIRARRITLVVFGALALLLGLFWVGQGSGVIPGSFMSGNRMWLYIGGVLGVAGIVLIVLGLRRWKVRDRT
jgi:uncharacterized membrane protein YdcZ (DUF606 family)